MPLQPSTKTARSRRGAALQADESDALLERAVATMEDYVAGFFAPTENSWPKVVQAAKDELNETLETCKAAIAKCTDSTRRKRYQAHAKALKAALSQDSPPFPKEWAKVRLFEWRVGEPVVKGRVSSSLVTDLTIVVTWQRDLHLTYGGWMFHHADGYTLNPVLKTPKVHGQERRETWRYVVAPPGSGVLKVATRLRGMRAALSTKDFEPSLSAFGVISSDEAVCQFAEHQGFKAWLIKAQNRRPASGQLH